jgi:hypothetical protein
MVYSGVLLKCGSVFPTWKARFFILDHNVLSYFEHEGGSKKGEFIISSDTVVSVSTSLVVEHVFSLQNSTRTLYLSGENEIDVKNWVTAFEDTIRVCKTKIQDIISV